MAIASLLLGLLGIVVALVPLYAVTQTLAVILGAAAIMLGKRARRQALATHQQGRTVIESVGIGTGIAAVLLGAVVFISCQGCKYAIGKDEGIQNEVQRVQREFRGTVKRLLRGQEGTPQSSAKTK